ncbi:MAG TPA: hypothetical protein VIT38_15875 [Allosphingosinicella sp.]
MSFSYSDFAAELKAGRVISAEDVLSIRRWVWPDGAISEAEAEAMFTLHRLARDAGAEWADFFIEAIGEYVVNGTAPRGYVDDAGAVWLIGEIEHDSAAIGETDLELVVKVLERALNVPDALRTWALGRIESAVLNGEGPTRRGDVRPGVVDEAEVTLLRRIVFAAAGDGALVVSEAEAEMLWRLKDAALNADNAPGWKQLFVQAVGNHLMAYSAYKPLEREEAARLDAFVADHKSSVLGFFGRMRGASPRAGLSELMKGEELRFDPKQVDAARAVTPDEQSWLDRHVEADGARDPYEEALLAFVEAERARD